MAIRFPNTALLRRTAAELPSLMLAASGSADPSAHTARHFALSAQLQRSTEPIMLSSSLRASRSRAHRLVCQQCGWLQAPASAQISKADNGSRLSFITRSRPFASSATSWKPHASSANAAPTVTVNSSSQQPYIAINPLSSGSEVFPLSIPLRANDINLPTEASVDAGASSLRASTDKTSPACATLSPSSPSAPKSQQSPSQQQRAEEAKAAAKGAAKTSISPSESFSRRGGAAFRAKKAALSITEQAVVRLRALSESPSGPKLIRIGVRNKGCAGMSYHLEYVSPEQAGKFDEKVEQDGVQVLIDSKALFSIIGSEMDWKDNKLSSKFIFNNPNVKEACGCGESFL
ncbi:hypothetical protein K437DRAFT_258252, partial [Tilletiaria anomala UBC 951]